MSSQSFALVALVVGLAAAACGRGETSGQPAGMGGGGATTTSGGTGDPSTACVKCAYVYPFEQKDLDTRLCQLAVGPTVKLYQAIEQCACTVGDTTCGAVCGDNACSGANSEPVDCTTCLNDKCADQLAACRADTW